MNNTLQNKVIDYAKANEKTLKKLGLIMSPTLQFPNNKVPFLSRLAIKILNKQGAKIDFIFRGTEEIN